MRKLLLALALLLSAPMPAAALTTYMSASEDIDATTAGTITIVSAGGSHRSTYVRTAWQCSNCSSTADPPANLVTYPVFTSAQSTFWAHARISTSSSAATLGVNVPMLILSDGGTRRLYVRFTATNGQVKFSTRNAAGTFADLATSAAGAIDTAAIAGTPLSLDWKVVYGTSGSLELWHDGVQILTHSGDNTTNSATTLDQMETVGINTGNSWFSEIIVSDTDTRDQAVMALQPVASGTTQTWTPNTVGNINELVLSDATVVASTVNNDLSGWTTPTTFPSSSTGGWTVASVTQTARVLRSAAGPQQFAFYCRVGGTDVAGADVALTTGFVNYRKQWDAQCNTAAAWSTGDIIAGFNLGLKARP
jgi:hypothetical protein